MASPESGGSIPDRSPGYREIFVITDTILFFDCGCPAAWNADDCYHYVLCKRQDNHFAVKVLASAMAICVVPIPGLLQKANIFDCEMGNGWTRCFRSCSRASLKRRTVSYLSAASYAVAF